MNNAIERILAAPWLGHGRATEALLTIGCIIYGTIVLIAPSTMFHSRAVEELAWEGYGRWLAAPFFLKAALSGSGLTRNVLGRPGSQVLRFFGGMAGAGIWAWIFCQSIKIDDVATIGFAFSGPFFLISIRIMALAWANLPSPGAPGRLS
jgi:hypothetical protein